MSTNYGWNTRSEYGDSEIIRPGITWIKAQCSHVEKGKRCPITGMFPRGEEEGNHRKQHFCQKHNPRVIEMIRKERKK